MGSSTDNKTQINPFKAIILPTSPPCKTETNGHDFRNVMLVGAALIATVTFQAGITPPGGVWQSDDNQGHRAGHAVYSDQKVPFQIFLMFNTIALTFYDGHLQFWDILYYTLRISVLSPHLRRCSCAYCNTVCHMGGSLRMQFAVQEN
ncbi:hypothetical protein POTOM_046318 [Populus tomentosa]|uniref:PGG domain-containing protein n=1 Tax=Populus tomentosa TaxID=118781 RepID=A0A8X7YQD2_POPTO|nr:hypothetical protein POTOM_046318 [Populus tomentosa]